MEIADKIIEAIDKWEADWREYANYPDNPAPGYDAEKAFQSRMERAVTWRDLLTFIRWMANRLKG